MWIFNNLIGKDFTDTKAFLSLVYVQNNGAAFNLFAGQQMILIIFAILVVFACLYYVFTYKLFIPDTVLLVIAFFCAGTIGNTYERILTGYVEDYIKINLYDFPVFNLNDIFVTVSAVLLVIIFVTNKYKEYKEIKDVEEDDLYRNLD